MQELPVSLDNFSLLRRKNRLYVDKSQRLAELADRHDWVFLARPRRFGKSLTVSTLEAMFSGRMELFHGLGAEAWVAKRSESPLPVLRLNLGRLPSLGTVQELNDALVLELLRLAGTHGVQLPKATNASTMLNTVLHAIYDKSGEIVVLIDEYDKPMLNNIDDIHKIEEIRRIFCDFYSVLKACSECIFFAFITGISKFAKFGLFSSMNNLDDISMNEEYGDILGCTQKELESYYEYWIQKTCLNMNIDRLELLEQIRKYYDGFCFDGKTKVYNPFSLNNFFAKGRFDNYWNQSAQSSFLIKWIKKHRIDDPDRYRHLVVPIEFADSLEIENAKPESFLYQSGYLTIEKIEGQQIVIDYPNYEVIRAISKIYAEFIYKIDDFITLGNDIWDALAKHDFLKLIRAYNVAIAKLPYDEFPVRNEYWYRMVFESVLRGAGIIVYAEVHTYKGRSDIVIQRNNEIYVIEFKLAKDETQIQKKIREGWSQIREKGYAEGYKDSGRFIAEAVIVVDDKNKVASISTSDEI